MTNKEKQKKFESFAQHLHDKININVVMLDSISRAHFFRSLKKTIRTFDEINSDTQSGAEVLDFQQFQALHGHSADNSRALFTGHVFPKEFTQTKKEESSVGIEEF